MAFCNKCGAELADGSVFCRKCGAKQPVEAVNFKKRICPKCRTENANGFDFCANCGTDLIDAEAYRSESVVKKPKSKAWMIPVVIAAVAALIVIIIAANANKGSDSNKTWDDYNYYSKPSTAASTSKPASDAEFLWVEEPVGTLDDVNRLHIEGAMKNISGEDYSFVSVKFTVYDSNGYQIDTATASIFGLKRNETWKFDAMSLKTNAASYELDGITAY